MSLWRSTARYEPSRGSVRSWVLRAVHNRTIDAFRRELSSASQEVCEDWISEALPAGVLYVSAAPGAGTYDGASGVWTVPTVAQGSSASLVITALVKPNKSLAEVDAKSVRKKMKDKAFARNVSRDDITKGAAELGVDVEEHIAFCIEAMKGIAKELGLAGS